MPAVLRDYQANEGSETDGVKYKRQAFLRPVDASVRFSLELLPKIKS